MSSFQLLVQISRALMLARWKQTLVAAFGVLFSIAMFITLLGFMNGLNAMLDGLILNRTPHVRLYNEVKSREQPIDKFIDSNKSYNFISSVKPSLVRKEIYNSNSIIESIKKDPRVEGVAPKVIAQVFFTIGAIELTGVVNGIDPEAESNLFHFSEYVTTGNYQDLYNVPNSIILGKGLADKLMASIDDQVYITTAQGERFALKVVGYFQSGIADLDKVNSYASIQTTQKILVKNSNYLSDIQVKLKDLNQAPFVAKEYAQKYEVDAEDIQTANAQFETGSDVRSIISYAVGITLLIVAGFGIYNILNMMIYEKMDTIAILKATGFSGSDVKNIFLIVALSIGVVGGAGGLLFGLGLSMIIDQIPFITAALPTITTFPIDYNPKYYIIASTFALVTTYLAGFFPARKASFVDPVVIIRGK
jgi:lipoprotein-releasing system permease protein